ncbi:NTP transferase domain-containing protein [candidate division GN15 bacterium]|nr:NTP transferase domain-containing protein [candidate division GN15 bacterium]
MNYAIIMAGGRGERFWPLSRRQRPKQFLKLTSDRTMLEATIQRVEPLIQRDHLRIVTTEDMTEQVETEISGVTPANILAEPYGRNTCLAIGLAAVHLRHEDDNAVMVVLSADHLIRPAEKLLAILRDGMAIASMEDVLITIGIVPTRPDTGYGYIKFGELFKREGDSTVYDVVSFAEKPKAAVAQEYYFSKRYFWNSGMFIWSVSSILEAIRKHQPEMGKQLDAYAETIGTDKEHDARTELYQNATSISIDYAVLEHADNVKVIKGEFLWDDVGSWNALERYKERDSENNVQIGETALLDTYETTVYNDAEGLIACIGVADLVIVRSGQATLVVHKTKTGTVKELLAQLSKDEKYKKYL